MANKSFNNVRLADNISLGGFVPVDDNTEALWIFDGSLWSTYYVRDWSKNENHLIPQDRQVPKFDYSQFSKVLDVYSGITSFKTSRQIQFSEFGPRCIELFFTNDIDNYDAGASPYVNYSGLFGSGADRVSSLIYRSGKSIFYLTQAGRFRLSYLGNDLPSTETRDILDPDLETDKYHSTSDYVSPFYNKNWFGFAINYPQYGANGHYWLNGAYKETSGGDDIDIPILDQGYNDFELFPDPQLARLDKLAFIRISNKHRTPEEINTLLNYFSSADGYFSNLHIFSRPQGDKKILNLSAEVSKSEEYLFEYTTDVDFVYTKSGIVASEIDFYQTVNLTSGLTPVFDYDALGQSRGLKIERGKINSVADAQAGFQSDYSGSISWFSTDGNPEVPLNHDPFTLPVFGDNYGYTGPDGFNFWNLEKRINPDIPYTYSVWVKKTFKASENGFFMTFSTTSDPSYFLDPPFYELVEAHPLLSGMYTDGATVWAAFQAGDHYNEWQRLWVTFKLKVSQNIPANIVQITNDNQQRVNKPGLGDKWAMDCHQFEEGYLTSWKPEYLQTTAPPDCYITTSGLNADPEHGTFIIDYKTINTYSGVTAGWSSIFTLDNKLFVRQDSDGIYIKTNNYSKRLLNDTSTADTYRLALSWDSKYNRFDFYKLSPGSVTSVSGVYDEIMTTPVSFNTLKDYDVSNQLDESFHIKNIRIFKRALSLDELGTYN